jgi:PAS domain S-box-containing protein
VRLLRRRASGDIGPDGRLKDAAVLAAARAHGASRSGQGLDATAIVTESRLLRREIGRVLREHPRTGVRTADVVAAEPVLHDALDGALLLALEGLTKDQAGRRRAEEAPPQGEELLRLLVERVEDYAIFLLDPEGRVATWNAGAERIKGYTAGEIVGRPYATFFTEADRAAGKPERLLRRARSAGRVEDEGWRVRKDGSRFWADALLTALSGARGRLLGYAKITRDLTERREAEKQRLLSTTLRELAETRDRALAEARAERGLLEAVVRQLPAGVVVAEAPSGRLILGNEQFDRIWRRPFRASRAIAEYAAYRGFHPDGRPYAPEEWPLARAIATGELVRDEEIEIVRGDGTRGTLLASAAPIRDQDGRTVTAVTTAVDVTDRRRAEEALRLRSDLVQAAYEAIFVWAVDDGLTLWNRGAEEQYGYTAAEALGRRSHDLLRTPPEQVAALTAGLEREGRWEGELTHTAKDGRRLVVEARLVRVHGPGAGQRHVLEAARDVTERRRAEAALRASEARSSFLAEAGRVLGSSLDYEATLANVAQLAVPHVGDWCAVDLLVEGGSLRRLAVAHADPEKVRFAHELQARYPPDPNTAVGPAHVVRTGRPEVVADIPEELVARSARDPEHLALLRGLGLRSSMVVPVRLRGQPLGAITFVAAESGRRFGPEDLTVAEELAGRAAVAIENARLFAQQEQARAAAERAAERTRRLQAITSQLSRSLEADAVLGTIANSAAELIGAPVGAVFLLETPDADFVLAAAHGLEPSRAGALRLPRRTSLAGRAVDQRRTLVANDVRKTPGTALPRLLTGQTAGSEMAAPILFGAESLGVVKVFSPTRRRFDHDDAELLSALAAAAAVALTNARLYRQAQEAIRVRDDFLAAASHDLKNPLGAIRGNAQLLLRTLDRTGAVPPQRLTSALTSVIGSTDQMVGLINELLDVARLRLGEPLPLDRAPTDLVALVRRAVAAHQAATDQHRFDLRLEVPELVGEWDAARLERVVGNLVSNAIKYSPEGGAIVVGVRREGDRAVLTVSDQGVGIPAADLPRVFERFERARNVVGRIGGSGIGLAATKQIVEQHGGRISVESREDQGSTFTVRLPLPAPGPPTARGTAGEADGSARGERATGGSRTVQETHDTRRQ